MPAPSIHIASSPAASAQGAYQLEGWGDGHFGVNDAGHLTVLPLGPGGPAVDLWEVTEELAASGHPSPLVLRFPQILESRVGRLHDAFRAALLEYECKDVRYRGVFPIKVNQRQEVVKTLCRSGRRHHHGLEVGSKAELIAALAMDPNRRSLLIVNGFKDPAYLEAACQAAHLKDEVVIVLDEVGELPAILPLLERDGPKPVLGIRLKLRAQAPGKWALSGGERSKFGLSVPQVLDAVERLREAGHLGRLQMLHFHIGSQISDIRRISDGIREAARVHAELVCMDVPLRMLDVGGGLAIDYDGAGRSDHNGANYIVEEYASAVVGQVHAVCTEAGVPVPDLISESGRATVAHHAVLTMDVLRRIGGVPAPKRTVGTDAGPEHGAPHDASPPSQAASGRAVPEGPAPDDPTPLRSLYELVDWLTVDGQARAVEALHDALQHRDDMQHLFDLGHLSLPALGRGERLFRTVVATIRGLLEDAGEEESEEHEIAAGLLQQKLVCNFSMFQSLPDVWGVKQLFPVVPLHRLDEAPTELATVADITCDSDGEIREFIGPDGPRDVLPVHADDGNPYRLAATLVGAYQDPLGDYHNLFGETEEAFITAEPDGTWRLDGTADGSKVSDMLRWVRYDPGDLQRKLRARIRRQVEKGTLDEAGARACEDGLLGLLGGGTYLDGPGGP